MATARPRLDRRRVLDAGIAFADREGLATLSMRSLAAELGVVPMALYKHVGDKDDLLGGMIDTVVEGYEAPASGLAWRESVRARVLAARRSLLRHPWLRGAIETRTTRTPAILAHMNAVAGDFITGGVSVDLTHYAMHALGHRIWGFSPEAFDEPAPDAPAPSPDEQAAMMQHMGAAYPHVLAIAMDAATRTPTGACDEQFEFEFTLDLLLDAFERLDAAGWQSN